MRKGTTAFAKGMLREFDVLDACCFQDWAKPDWVLSIRPGSEEKDAQGIDFVMYTKDVGKIFIQVKSSHRGALRFMDEHPRNPRHIVLIVVDDRANSVDIRRRIMDGAEKERAWRLAKRNHSEA
ncbi:MAG: hypothetical protein A2542_00570 [Parcubacteria group bacterium RIFOXYD2_FULL_52_8]|nr:MAG: hypothetical protein A2542_00570 [Parcubacteria group bacterium RIFOXYD2_FULL_52_8]